jgi:hypothetical protein
MNELNELPPERPVRERESRADAKVLTRSLRRLLKQVADLDSGETFADRINANLVNIASSGISSLSMQAIKAAIELCGAQSPAVHKARRGSAEETGMASLRPTAEEEAMTDEELDAQLAELQARLASIPTVEN